MALPVVENTRAFLNTNVLHTKPLSSRMFHGVQHLNISIAHLNIEEGWKRKAVCITSKVLTLATYAISFNIALIEGISAAIFGFLGTLTQLAFTKNNDVIEKYSIKLLAYGLNSICTAGIAIASLGGCFSSRNDWALPDKHMNVSIFEGYTYLGSAATAQLFCTIMFNSIRGIKDNSPNIRATQASIEGTPYVFSDIVHSMNREYEMLGCENDFNPDEFARDYITAYPPSATNRDWTQDFDLGDFLEGQVFGPLTQLMEQFSDQYNLIAADGILERRETEVIMNPLSEAEKSYHDHLKTCVKEAIRHLIQDEWAKYIEVDNDFEKGKDRLAFFDAPWTIPIANIAQLIELEQPITCPETFNHADLVQHNNRLGIIRQLKPLLLSLTPNDKALLIERLIKTSMFELGARHYDHADAVDQLYNGIFRISHALHQGRLLTLPTINTDTLEGGGENYFGRCWGIAVEEYDVDPEDVMV